MKNGATIGEKFLKLWWKRTVYVYCKFDLPVLLLAGRHAAGGILLKVEFFILVR